MDLIKNKSSRVSDTLACVLENFILFASVHLCLMKLDFLKIKLKIPNYETIHSIFSFSISPLLLLPRAIFVSSPVSQLPLLAKIWYIKIYHLSVLLLSFIAQFIFTSSHLALPFLYFYTSHLQRLLFLFPMSFTMFLFKKNLCSIFFSIKSNMEL